MKLLFVTTGPDFAPASRSRWAMQDEIIKNLEGRNVECKRIVREGYLGNIMLRLPILNRKKRNNFERLLDEFGPDAVILDVPNDLGLIAASREIPLLVCFWDEWIQRKIAREEGLIFRSLFLAVRERAMDPCLKRATVILAETDSISNIIRRHYPASNTVTFPYTSIDTDRWKAEGRRGAMDLRHPCVGLLQYADRWSKAREMLVLSRVMEALPHVTFYWAGDGKYRDRVLAALSAHSNFEWMGALERHDEVREYLSSIDIYGLAAGEDMSPYSLKMAMCLEMPAIATDVGGVSETMRDGETGFLVGRGDHEGWVERISQLLNDAKKAQDMGRRGRRFVQDNWDSGVAAERLVGILEGIRQT